MDGRTVPGCAGRARRDYYAGALMVLIGLYAVVQGASYGTGTLTSMGAGFFPVALGAILALIGFAIAGTARRPRAGATLQEGSMPTEDAGPQWRGWICILAGVASFPVLGRWGGLLPATFAITFISALGDRDNGMLSAFLLALVMSVVAAVVFWWALELQLPPFSWG